MGTASMLVIGALTNDITSNKVSIGGPAYFITYSLACLDLMPTVITNSYELLDVIKHICISKISRCVYAPKDGTVFIFEIKEAGRSRELRLIKKAPSIDPLIRELIDKWVSSDVRFSVAIVSPVFNEVSGEVVAELKRIADYIVVDIQGFVRKCEDGQCCRIAVDEQRFYRLMRILAGSVNLIRGELLEFPRECRGDNIRNCILGSVDVVQTNGPSDMYVYLSELDRVAKLRPLPGIEGSSIGAGDIFTGVLAYFIARGFDLLSSCARAAVAAGLKVGRSRGPWFTLPELEMLSHKVLKHIKF